MCLNLLFAPSKHRACSVLAKLAAHLFGGLLNTCTHLTGQHSTNVTKTLSASMDTDVFVRCTLPYTLDQALPLWSCLNIQISQE